MVTKTQGNQEIGSSIFRTRKTWEFAKNMILHREKDPSWYYECPAKEAVMMKLEFDHS